MRLSGNLSKVAKGLGGTHVERVEEPRTHRAAFERAFAAKQPAVVEVLTMIGVPEATRI